MVHAERQGSAAGVAQPSNGLAAANDGAAIRLPQRFVGQLATPSDRINPAPDTVQSRGEAPPSMARVSPIGEGTVP
jgi:hypothetical protein